MRAGGYGDLKPEDHPLKQTIVNLHFMMIFVTHIRIFCKGSRLELQPS
jgi:hypothetical protein